MRVILLKSVSGVGQAGEVKDVADGYGFNYLIARGLAKQATGDALAGHEKLMTEKHKASAAHKATLVAQLRAADGQRVVVRVKANEKGHLFKGIKQDDVALAIADAFGGFLTPETIRGFEGVIREAGEHVIHLAGAGAEATVHFVVEAVTS